MTAISAETQTQFKIACATLFTELREREFSYAKRVRNAMITALAVSIILTLSIVFATPLTAGKLLLLSVVPFCLSIAAIGNIFNARSRDKDRDFEKGVRIPFTTIDELQNVHTNKIPNIRIAPSNQFDRSCLRNISDEEFDKLNYLIYTQPVVYAAKVMLYYEKYANETNPMERLVTALRSTYLDRS